MDLCVRGINVASLYDFLLDLELFGQCGIFLLDLELFGQCGIFLLDLNCSDSVVFFYYI